MTPPTQEQLDAFARRLRVLESELAELRVQARGASAPTPTVVAPPVTARVQWPPPQPAVDPPLPRPQPSAAPRPPREPLFRLPELPKLEPSDLLGARALAVAGGIVTLLGIVFFFVLAVNRGWVGPVGRVGLGAGAALAVFLGGLELRRRFGDTYSSLAAVGTGIAGGYATLLSAAALYGLLPDYASLVIAAAIASAAVATSIFWRSQLVAGFGLIGAMLVPLAVVAQGGLSALGTAFVAVVLAATAIVTLRRRWRELLVAGVLTSAPQIVALAYQADHRAQSPWRIVLLASVFAFLYAASGVTNQLRAKTSELGMLTTSLTFGGALLAAVAMVRLYATPREQGVALLAIAVVYGLATFVFFMRRATRDLGALLAAIAFTLGAFAAAELLSGQPLAYVWAAEAAALAWLARRVRELRFQVWSGVYLLLALGHVLLLDAIPSRLFVATDHPASGALAALAFAAAACVVGFHARDWNLPVPSSGGVYRIFAGFFALVHARQFAFRSVAFWLGGVVATYALSLGTLSVASFDWGYVALTGIWSTLGLGLLFAGLLRSSVQLRRGGIAWLGATTAIVFDEGLVNLATTPGAVAFAVLAIALIAGALAYALRIRNVSLEPVAVIGTLVSLTLACYAIGESLDGDVQGFALLGLAAVYGAVAAALFRRAGFRDLVTMFWGIAVVLGAVADGRLLGGTYSVLGWAAAGAALALLSRRARERRFLVGAASYLALAFARAFVFEAPPSHLFVARVHPAAGAPAILIVAVAIAVFACFTARGRRGSWWLAGVLAVYGLSLSILELVARAFDDSLHADFQRGHTAVSAFWGLLGLVLLYAGLKRWRSLRLAGLALFAISLGKIFVYDLPSLSSITRALSFLAVGAVLLLGGFFYQRLSVEETPSNAASP